MRTKIKKKSAALSNVVYATICSVLVQKLYMNIFNHGNNKFVLLLSNIELDVHIFFAMPS